MGTFDNSFSMPKSRGIGTRCARKPLRMLAKPIGPTHMKTALARRLIAATFLHVTLTASLPAAYAQGGIPLWTNRYHGPSSGHNGGTGIAVDSSGNVFVTGASIGGSNVDYATIAYTDGGVPSWTNRYPAQANFNLQPKIALDRSGNVFVTGISPPPGTTNNIDFATVAYSGAGVPLWTNRYPAQGDPANSHPRIALDSKGDVIVTGPAMGVNSNLEYAAIAYSNAGTPIWTNRYHGSAAGNDYAWALALDRSDNIFVTGWSTGGGAATLAYSNSGVPLWTNYFNGQCLNIAVGPTGNVFVIGFPPVIANNYQYATIAYSNSGLPLWTNIYAGPGNGLNVPAAIAVDNHGNVFVTGQANAPGWVYGTLAYSPAGVPLWTNLYAGPGINDLGLAIALDAMGNAFVTGNSTTPTGLPVYGTAGYSGAGVPLWTNRYEAVSNGFDFGSSIAVDAAGNVFVTGSSQSTNGDMDYATIKYSSSIRPYLAIQKTSNHAVLTWTNAGFLLQSTPVFTGSFTNIPGAASPYYSSSSDTERYFRLTAP